MPLTQDKIISLITTGVKELAQPQGSPAKDLMRYVKNKAGDDDDTLTNKRITTALQTAVKRNLLAEDNQRFKLKEAMDMAAAATTEDAVDKEGAPDKMEDEDVAAGDDAAATDAATAGEDDAVTKPQQAECKDEAGGEAKAEDDGDAKTEAKASDERSADNGKADGVEAAAAADDDADE